MLNAVVIIVIKRKRKWSAFYRRCLRLPLLFNSPNALLVIRCSILYLFFHSFN